MPATLEKRPSLVKHLFRTSIGKKVLTGLTGVLLLLFITQHLLANIQVLGPDPQALNRYGPFLEGFGVLLDAAQFGLAGLVLLHAVIGISIWFRKRKARGTEAYAQYASKGTPSKQSLSSKTMIASGLFLLVFLGLHLNTFKFGPGVEEGYVVVIDDAPVRDLTRLVTERYQSVGYVLFYVVAMVVVGFHLHHGFWSAFQSLGLVNDRNRNRFFWTGAAFSIVVTAGFLAIPLVIYFGGGG